LIHYPDSELTTNVIVFDFTRPRLELTIYNTRDEHSKHYTTDAVLIRTDMDVSENDNN